MEDKIKDIREKIELYSLRKAKIEDMKLELIELELGETLKAQEYNESVQASIKCKNNDELLLKKERLINKIKFYEVSNNRVDKWLGLIKNEKAREAIEYVYIQKMSKTQTCKKMDRTRKSVENLLRKGEIEIYRALYE